MLKKTLPLEIEKSLQKTFNIQQQNSSYEAAQIICFGENHFDEKFKQAVSAFLFCFAQPSDLILKEGLWSNTLLYERTLQGGIAIRGCDHEALYNEGYDHVLAYAHYNKYHDLMQATYHHEQLEKYALKRSAHMAKTLQYWIPTTFGKIFITAGAQHFEDKPLQKLLRKTKYILIGSNDIPQATPENFYDFYMTRTWFKRT